MQFLKTFRKTIKKTFLKCSFLFCFVYLCNEIKTTEAMKYIAYYRVSTQKQGLGLDAQRSAAYNYCKSDDEIVAEYQEKESGKKDDRPELMVALAECKRVGATLLIAKLDRLSRNVRFLFAIKESGIKFQACDCPELDTMTLSILAGFAQRERELISTRTKAALAELKAKGVKLGAPNAAFTDAMREQASKAKKEAALTNENNLRAWGCIKNNLGLSYAYLAQTLNETKHCTPTGGMWRGNQVKRLIEMYTNNN